MDQKWHGSDSADKNSAKNILNAYNFLNGPIGPELQTPWALHIYSLKC